MYKYKVTLTVITFHGMTVIVCTDSVSFDEISDSKKLLFTYKTLVKHDLFVSC